MFLALSSPPLVKLGLLFFLGLMAVLLIRRLGARPAQVALAMGGMVVGVLLAEGGLRLSRPQLNQHDDLFEPDDVLGWRMRASMGAWIVQAGGVRQYIQTNTLGFRGAEPRSPRPARRLLVVGDSFTTNLAVPDEAVFTARIEDRLGMVEVLNLGVNGYGTLQEQLLLDRHLASLQPDGVLLVVYLQNDFHDNVDNPWIFARPTLAPTANGLALRPAGAHPPPRTARIHPRRWSHLYALLDRVVEQGLAHLHRRTPGPWRPPELMLCQREPDTETQQLYDAFFGALDRLEATLQAHHVPLAVALAPSDLLVEDALWDALLSSWDADPTQLVRGLPAARITARLHAQGIPVLDLTPALQARPGGQYHPTERHWTVAGNATVAEALAPWLADLLWP